MVLLWAIVGRGKEGIEKGTKDEEASVFWRMHKFLASRAGKKRVWRQKQKYKQRNDNGEGQRAFRGQHERRGIQSFESVLGSD